MASNDETTDLFTTTGPTGEGSRGTATGRGDSGPNGQASQGGQGGQGTDAGAPDGGAAPAAEPAPAKKAARKRAPRKATAARTTPAHHDAEAVTGTPDAPAAAADGATEVPAASAPDEDAAPPAAKRAPRKAAKRAPRKSAKKAAAAPSAETAEAVAATTDLADLADEETDETLSAVTAEATPQTTSIAPTAPEAAAEGGTSVEQTPAEQPAAESERQATAPAPSTGLGLLFQAPDPTAAPRRRRATAPATAPAAAPAAGEAPARAVAPEAEETDRGAARATGRPESSESDADADAEGDGGGRRRRRRGGKGRKTRASGDGTEADASSADGQVPADDTAAAATTAGDTADTADTGGADDTGPEDTEDNEGGPSRRRTRRRRRSGGGSGESEEQPGVVTRVREPRKEPQRDEVTSVKGSTRLEAKKQRRREGREAGRRRTIITEAEFLARRESVERVMVVRNKDDRTQIAVLEDKVLVEHYVSRESNVSMAGNIYLGRVQNVLPSMEAAFVDIGKGRNAVLYAGEVNWDAAGLSGNRAKRIENALSSGDGVLVQVTKDPIGHKGARLTSQISLPGRYLVYVPDGNMTGISRKLPDTERARLKKILREIVPENAGVIVRTAAEGASEDELRADVARLTATWEDIKAKASSSQTKAPALLHGEPDLTVRVIRDVFNEDFASLVVAGEPAWSQVSGYVSSVAPDLADRVTKWTGEQDLFTHYRVDEQIAKAMDRKVWLPSGGSLVIDRTEAMTVVDVNTGKFVGSGGNLEETVTKNNIEAAEEVVRQLRLRDIGGIIVIDFIDMVLESNRDLVVRRLLECLGRDRTKHQVAEVTSLGLVQMTRKRVGSGLIEVFSETCEHCNGRGFIIHADPVDQNGGNGSGSTRDNGNRGGDNANRGGDNANRGGDNGSAGDGARGSRSRRGRGGREQGGPAQAEPATAAPSGPTPAQIAAAAHQAALLASQAVAGDDDALVDDGEVTSGAGLQEVEAAAVLDAVESQQPAAVQPPETAPPAQHSVEAEQEQPAQAEAPAQQDAVAAPAETAPVAEEAAAPVTEPETAPAPEEAAPDQAAPAAQPAQRGRRKRARVVAPAGPPGGATGTPVGEFAEQGADHVV